MEAYVCKLANMDPGQYGWTSCFNLSIRMLEVSAIAAPLIDSPCV